MQCVLCVYVVRTGKNVERNIYLVKYLHYPTKGDNLSTSEYQLAFSLFRWLTASLLTVLTGPIKTFATTEPAGLKHSLVEHVAVNFGNFRNRRFSKRNGLISSGETMLP